MSQRNHLILAVLILVLGLLPGKSEAALLPGVNTLADLLSRGEVTVNDVRYYDFIYLRTVGGLPATHAVRVDAPADGARGLTLSADWSAQGDAIRTILFQFKVDVGPSVNRFATVTTSLTGRSESPTRLASLTDTITAGSSDIVGPTVTRVVADTAGGTISTTEPLSLAVTGFTISKVLSFQASSSIASVSTTFVGTHLPEPGALGLGLLVAGLGLHRRRR